MVSSVIHADPVYRDPVVVHATHYSLLFFANPCYTIPMKTKPKRLRVLNDFAFQKSFGEKGSEPQLISFLNAVL
ncbi:MAG: Rpn family recombination-promoting nuclease/putative transposase, partial [Spirochaetaceae bacterium]|nr:Rpn family recombination-promoting nuclease/putative transposase [Spirochaetaceae bacterium]